MNLKELHEKIKNLLEENDARGVWIVRLQDGLALGSVVCSKFERKGFIEYLKADVDLDQKELLEELRSFLKTKENDNPAAIAFEK